MNGGLELGLRVVGEDVRVGRLGRAERPRVERPVGLEDLRVTDRDLAARVPAHAEPDEAGRVLARIERAGRRPSRRPISAGSVATTRTGGAIRGSMIVPSNGTTAAGRQPVIEAGVVPAGGCSAEVDDGPVVQVRRADLARRRQPAPSVTIPDATVRWDRSRAGR